MNINTDKSTRYKRITLHLGKDKSLSRLHPWVFSGAIENKDKNIAEGDITEVYTHDGQYIATGFFQNGTIAVKILTFEREKIDFDFFDRRIRSAVNYRKTMGMFGNENNNIFRVVNAEGDFMPGFIADYYAGRLVVQFHSAGMYLMRGEIVSALRNNLKDIEFIFSKSSSTLPKSKDIEPKDEFLFGCSDQETFVAKENSIQYLIDYKQGQKTGFFVDQQSNRELLCKLSYGKKVLNCFGYTGGFSLSALKGGALSVETLDISKRALEICTENAKINAFADRHVSQCEDVVRFIDNIPKDVYDIIVLDPPAFAKHQRDLQQALKGYRTINKKAMEKIKSGGLIFTFSCSQAVSKEDFLTMLFSCAVTAKRKVRIVRRLPHNVDHPQSIFHPEGEYLKGFLLYVE
ncbi:MAG: class I SAM-dependent rRNA methyltransferase [Bacteroidales bacterium]|nr:class I SAM-dependent rRNA methyltransferase [Bacteroidales bacterium]